MCFDGKLGNMGRGDMTFTGVSVGLHFLLTLSGKKTFV